MKSNGLACKFNGKYLIAALFLFFIGFGSAQAQTPSGKGNWPIFSLYQPSKLAQVVCKNAHSDEEKVRAINAWICYHIKYDAKRFYKSSSKRFSSKWVLWRKRALCDEYAALFNQMCEAVNVNSFLVDGYLKSSEIELDDTLYTSNHAWNLVKVGENWQLMDLTFAAGYLKLVPSFWDRLNFFLFKPVCYSKLKFVRSLDSSYLFADPRYFAATHLPSMPDFQKFYEPISLYDFQNCDSRRCFESVEPSANGGTIEDYYRSSPKEKLIWHSDSIITFNQRNQMIRVIDLYNAAIEGLKEFGYTSSKDELPSDAVALKKIISYLDSSAVTIPKARAYVQEEYYHRKIKNQQRNKLAQTTIKPIQTQNKKTLSFSKKIEIRNKRKISNYQQVDKNLWIQKGKLLEQKTKDLKAEVDTNSESFKNEHHYNKRQIGMYLDSQQQVVALMHRNIQLIADSLLPLSYKKQEEISRFQDLIINLTLYSNQLRINHFDNLDAELADAQYFRAMFNDSLKVAFQTRNQNLRACGNLDLQNREHLNLLKQLHQNIKSMVDANANLGINNQDYYLQSLQLLCNAIDTLVDNHQQLVAYYGIEARWASPLLQKTRKQMRRLKAELAYENTRFMFKQELITSRNLSHKRALKGVGKMNRNLRSILHTQVKKLSK